MNPPNTEKLISLTDKQHRVMLVIFEMMRGEQAKIRGISPKEFAKKYWPDSPGWQRTHNNGPNGAAKGKILQMTAGRMLWKLLSLGMVYKHHSGNYNWIPGIEAYRVFGVNNE